MSSKRADLLLVERGLFASRSRAQQAIAAGLVSADGIVVGKASALLSDDAALLASPAHPWASRGGLKLVAALDAFGLDPAGLACLDIGASTGGFTDVLLSRGARKIVAIDVGRDQFDPRLKADPRVQSLEAFDARELTAEILGEAPEFIVCDVSFISQRLVLPVALSLAAPGAAYVGLVKPQFEVGRDHLKKGVVKNEAALRRACDDVRSFVEVLGWTSLGLIDSPVLGGDGAREFLYAARNG
jgi:23S rRNA (cytidine1920-2'-O)/16S rRNA (cytidine1409-2'-O)-methyltransferase